MSCKIQCEWIESKRIVVNPDGQVWPCCYLANSSFLHTELGEPTTYVPKQTFGIEDQLIDVERAAANTGREAVFKEYMADRNDYNIFHHTIEEVVDSKWFAETLPESWNDPNRTLWACSVYCSKDRK